MQANRDILRYFITTDGAWFTPTAASQLQQNVSRSMRRFWTNHAFDFAGFNIKSCSIQGEPGIRLGDALRRVHEDGNLKPEEVLKLTRILVSEHSIGKDDTLADDVILPKLLVTMSIGKDDRWGPGNRDIHADVSVTSIGAKARIETAISDIFNDIMVANGSMMTYLRRRFLSETNTLEKLFQLKVNYALGQIKDSGAPAMFPHYSPERYASFATLSRNGLVPGPLGINLEMLCEHWEKFACIYLSKYFLKPEEAAIFVTKNSFRRSSIGRRDNVGQNISKKTHFGNLSEEQLKKLFNDRQIVDSPGSYVLIVLTRTPTPEQADDIAPLLGWSSSNEGRVKRLKLVPAEKYQIYKEHVANGLLTPVRLFLRPGG